LTSALGEDRSTDPRGFVASMAASRAARLGYTDLGPKICDRLKHVKKSNGNDDDYDYPEAIRELQEAARAFHATCS